MVRSRKVLAAAALQGAVLILLVVALLTCGSDATTTSDDSTFVVFAALTPVALGIAFALGRSAKRTGDSAIWTSALHLVTGVALVGALVTAPLAIFGAVVFGPMD